MDQDGGRYDVFILYLHKTITFSGEKICFSYNAVLYCSRKQTGEVFRQETGQKSNRSGASWERLHSYMKTSSNNPRRRC